MQLSDVEKIRKRKDDEMRGYSHPESNEPAPERDRYSKDMFGGQHGIDPNSHGVELQ